MTPELNTTLTAITQICLAHSEANSILSRNEYDRLIQALAVRTDLDTLTKAEWITFYEGLPNVMRFRRELDASEFPLRVPAITDKAGFLYDIIINTSPSLRTSFVALVPSLLTRLQTQNAAFDTGEDDLDVIYAIENTLNLLIPHATNQNELHQWYGQSVALLNISATVSEAVQSILNTLAYQIVSLPNSLLPYKSYLDQLQNDNTASTDEQENDTELTDEQENALYRGYAIIAIQDPVWGWDFFKNSLEESLPMDHYPSISVTQHQTLFSLVPFLSQAEQWQRWNQVFNQLQTSATIKAHGPLYSIFVRLLIRLLPYLLPENIHWVKIQAQAIKNNANETEMAKAQMIRLLAYITPTEEQSEQQSASNASDTSNNDPSLIPLLPINNDTIQMPYLAQSNHLFLMDLSDASAVSECFYHLLRNWRKIGQLIEENYQDAHLQEQEQQEDRVIHHIQALLSLFVHLFPSLDAQQKRYFWHSLRDVFLSGFNNMKITGKIHTAIVENLYYLTPQLLADKNNVTLQENIALFRSTLHASLLCLSRVSEDEDTIPHIMSEKMNIDLVRLVFNALAAAVPYISSEAQWNSIHHEIESKALYTFLRPTPIFRLAMTTFTPVNLPLPNIDLNDGLMRLRNVENYQSLRQVQIMANDLVACIFCPNMYGDIAISTTVNHSLQRLLTHGNSDIQMIGLSVLNQWITEMVKPLVAYRSLALKKGTKLSMELIRLMAIEENRLALCLFERGNGINVSFYHDACKLLAGRLLLQLKSRAISPVLEKAIESIEKCWKLSPHLLQVSQTMYTTNTSQKRAAETNNDNSNSRCDKPDNKSRRMS